MMYRDLQQPYVRRDDEDDVKRPVEENKKNEVADAVGNITGIVAEVVLGEGGGGDVAGDVIGDAVGEMVSDAMTNSENDKKRHQSVHEWVTKRYSDNDPVLVTTYTDGKENTIEIRPRLADGPFPVLLDKNGKIQIMVGLTDNPGPNGLRQPIYQQLDDDAILHHGQESFRFGNYGKIGRDELSYGSKATHMAESMNYVTSHLEHESDQYTREQYKDERKQLLNEMYDESMYASGHMHVPGSMPDAKWGDGNFMWLYVYSDGSILAKDDKGKAWAITNDEEKAHTYTNILYDAMKSYDHKRYQSAIDALEHNSKRVVGAPSGHYYELPDGNIVYTKHDDGGLYVEVINDWSPQQKYRALLDMEKYKGQKPLVYGTGFKVDGYDETPYGPETPRHIQIAMMRKNRPPAPQADLVNVPRVLPSGQSSMFSEPKPTLAGRGRRKQGSKPQVARPGHDFGGGKRGGGMASKIPKPRMPGF